MQTFLFKWGKKVFKWFLAACLSGILLVGMYLAVLVVSRNIPLELPAPGGPYAVGRMELDWTDPKRVDPLAGRAGVPRELAVWIWYPAQADPSENLAPYLPPAWTKARNNDQGIGILIESELTKIRTHSYENAPFDASQSKFPILIMEPGMGPSIPDYTILAENLASHGYVVVGINPTYTSNLVAFPDGRIATRTPQGSIPDLATDEEADQLGNQIMAVWVQDVIFTMDKLEEMEVSPSGLFYGRLDDESIGVFGHSFGGATAIAVCEQDTRCQAAANLDGDPFSAEENVVISTPLLLVSEDSSNGCDLDCINFHKIAYQVTPGLVFDISVKGTGHFNFTDLPLRTVPAARPLFRAIQLTGPINPARGVQIVNTYLVAFFDRFLKDSDSGLLDGPSDQFPEVQFQAPVQPNPTN